MTQFKDRERAFEKKFELDEEIEFKILVRTARLFALWAGEQLGFSGAEAEAYVAQAIETVVTHSDREDLVKKIEQDLTAKGIVSNHRHLEMRINECEQQARVELT